MALTVSSSAQPDYGRRRDAGAMAGPDDNPAGDDLARHHVSV